MRNDKPTGKWRFTSLRRGLLGTVVAVEIEVEWEDGVCDHNGMPEYFSGKAWRLAKPSDIMQMNIKAGEL